MRCVSARTAMDRIIASGLSLEAPQHTDSEIEAGVLPYEDHVCELIVFVDRLQLLIATLHELEPAFGGDPPGVGHVVDRAQHGVYTRGNSPLAVLDGLKGFAGFS